MSDLFIFGFGLFVTVIVGSAVALLVWGASTEPSLDEVPDDEFVGGTPSRSSMSTAPTRG